MTSFPVCWFRCSEAELGAAPTDPGAEDRLKQAQQTIVEKVLRHGVGIDGHDGAIAVTGLQIPPDSSEVAIAIAEYTCGRLLCELRTRQRWAASLRRH